MYFLRRPLQSARIVTCQRGRRSKEPKQPFSVKDKGFLTSGGRVLNVCAAKENLTETMKTIYSAIEKIQFPAMHFRKDIGSERRRTL